MWSSKIVRVFPTSARHHRLKRAPYVVATRPGSLPPKGRRIGTVERTVDGHKVAVPVRLVRDETCPDGSVHMDQTIRTALGLRPLLTDEGQETQHLRLRPLSASLGDRLRDRLSWIGGRRYLLLRVARQDPGDIEKRICRIAEDDLVAMGAGRGRRVILIAAAENAKEHGNFSLARLRMQALDLSTERIAQRRAEEQATKHEGWNTRHPAVASLLGVEGGDLSYVFLDLDAREELSVPVGGVVLVRRDTLSAAIGEVQEFGITFLVSLISVIQFASTAVGLAVAAAISGLVLISRLRTELG